jgi:hypothetical protein
MLGTTQVNPPGVWIRQVDIEDVEPKNIHRHIFTLTQDQGWHPYQYQEVPLPNLSKVDPGSIRNLSKYLKDNKLGALLRLQVLSESSTPATELILADLTCMLNPSDTIGVSPHRTTKWVFKKRTGFAHVSQVRHMGRLHEDMRSTIKGRLDHRLTTTRH